MTVAELTALLDKFGPDAQVFIWQTDERMMLTVEEGGTYYLLGEDEEECQGH